MASLVSRTAFAFAFVLVACGDSGTGAGGSGGETGDGGAGGTPSTGGSPEGGAPTTGGGGAGEGGSTPSTTCEEICAFQVTLEEKFMCGYEGGSCVIDCEAAYMKLPEDCLDEAVGYNDCLMAQPTADFNCTDGIFTLTSGACEEAFGVYAECVNG